MAKTSATQTQQGQRTKQLTTLTVFMLTVLTVLTQMPANSAAAAIQAVHMHTSATPGNNVRPAALAAINAAEALSNQQRAVFQQLLDSTAGAAQHGRRKRLRKRHNDKMHLSGLASVTNDAVAPLEWVNACGFVREENAEPSIQHMMAKEEVVRTLRRALRSENTTINALHTINITGMVSWRKHSRKYKFLPTLNRTAKIELHHWHRAMQKFVASFAELGVKQYRWDLKNLQMVNATTHELNALLLSARRILCEVESAIHAVNPQAKIRSVSRAEMQKKLNFYSNDQALVDKKGVDPRDLRFAKQRYNKYVQHMLQIVRRQMQATRKRVGNRATAKSVASYSDESNYSHWLDLADLEGYDTSAQASYGMSDELPLAA
ncbi:uncharacterized protein LOC126759848 [Bactrocera neohumeralis]|uniref:uncharacterized protein LOC126759848 n=1 Tax=Bactrocera neohumeralis TaxID=98809 RepID=UPI002165FB0A|nr:uncharacterized protein LOC126759848 [Bactrocera neohumeralis]